MSKISTAVRRGSRIQSLMCAIGHHDYEVVGRRVDQGHRFSESHEALYQVTNTHAMMRCTGCAHEAIRLESVEQEQVGYYQRVYVDQKEI